MFKKLVAVAAVAAVVFTSSACGKAPDALDLDAVRTNVEALEFFPNLMEPDDEYLQSVCGIDTELISKRFIEVPLMNVTASSVWLVLPNDGAKERVKAMIDAYMANSEQQWSSYLPEQYELVKNRLVTEIDSGEGTWLVYIISENNDAALEAITSTYEK